MEPTLCFALFLILIPLYIFLGKRTSKRVPPGSLGLPIVGQTLNFLKAMRANKGEEWLQERINKYGHVSKLGLLGTPTVFLHGPTANKFVYSCDGNTLAYRQPASIRKIIGENNMFEGSVKDHKRVREALMTFLKPEALKQYVGLVDEEVKMHINKHWEGKQEIAVQPLMKALTFNIICTVIFGMERGKRRDMLVQYFERAVEGMLSVPVNFPFTLFRRSLQASANAKAIIMDLIHEKREALAQNANSSKPTDLITFLLSMTDERGSPVMSDQEIVDSTFVVMIAGHDTTSVLLSFLVKLLAKDQSIYAKFYQEQDDIAKSKGHEELLTWDDLAKMKYSWRVATEALRMYPPILVSFRQTLKDIEYEGYVIPKGWQVVWASCMTQMDEKIYPDPSKFEPTRHEQGTRAPFSFVAFGGGARSCPGYEFARMETLVMMHYMVTRFTWKVSLEDDSFKRDPLPVFNQGLPIKLEPKYMA